MPQEVVVDQETGAVYINLADVEPGGEEHRRSPYAKYGMTFVWDGHGGLLGVEFEGTVPVIIRTVNPGTRMDVHDAPGIATPVRRLYLR